MLAQYYNQLQSIGPDCGDVQIVVAAPNNASQIYAGTFGGIFKSTDGGFSWTDINLDLPAVKIQTIAIASAATNTIYLGTAGHGIFRLDPKLSEWEAINAELSHFNVQCLVVDPFETEALYAGTFGGGIFRSENQGQFWIRMSEGLGCEYVTTLLINPKNPSQIFAGTANGVYQTQNAAGQWALVASDLEFIHITALALDPRDPQMLYAATLKKGIYRINFTTGQCVSYNDGLTDAYVYSLAFSYGENQILFAGTHQQGIFKRTSPASPWIACNDGLRAVQIRTVLTHPYLPQVVWAGSYDGGIFRSEDLGGTWTEFNRGLAIASVTGIEILPGTVDWLVAGSERGIFQAQLPARWQVQVADLPINALAVQTKPAFKLFAATETEGVIFSSDNGTNWFYLNPGLSQPRPAITCLTVNPGDSLYAAIGTRQGEIFRFQPTRAVWENITGGNAVNFGAIHTLAMAPSATRLFMGCEHGIFQKYRNQAWTSLNLQLPYNPEVVSIALDLQQPYIIYIAVRGEGVFKSLHLGTDWVPLNTGLPNLNVTRISVHPMHPERLFLGTEANGLWASFNQGGDWYPIQNNSTTYPITTIRVTDDVCYIGTRNGGGYQLKLQPQLSIAAATHHFNNVEVDSVATWALEFENLGLTDLQISKITVTPDVFQTSATQLTLTPKQRQKVDISFTPNNRGTQMGSVSVQSNDPFHPQILINLQGKGIAPIIDLSNISSIDFKKQLLQQPHDSSFALYNLGDANLTITRVQFSNPCFTTSEKLPRSIAPRQSYLFRLRFLPDSVRFETGTLSLISNDPDENRNPLIIRLQGQGVAPVLHLVGRDTLNFGATFIDQGKELDFTLENKGNANLVITRFQCSNDRFQVMRNPPLTLGSSQTLPLAVRFLPDSIKSEYGQLQIHCNDPAFSLNPFTITLMGTGVKGETRLTCPVAEIQFGAVTLTTSRDTTFQIRNQGDYELTIQTVLCVPNTFQFLGTTPFTLKPSAEHSITLRFQPTIPRSEVGSIRIMFIGQAPDTLRLALSGEVRFAANTFNLTTTPGLEQNAFRMFSVPAILNQPRLLTLFSRQLGAPNIKQWRIFRWENGRYLELGQDLTLDLNPGRAFWLITKRESLIDFGAGVTLPTHQAFEVPLAPGWNQIGNPFPFAIDWLTIRDATSEFQYLDTLYQYLGEYQMTDILEPFTGYWIQNRNSQQAITLVIPPIPATMLLKPRPWPAKWWLQIAARCGQARDAENFLGVATRANAMWDPLDHAEPPGIGEFVSVRFSHPDWISFPDDYTTDFQPAEAAGWCWNFSVHTPITTDSVRLDFINLPQLPAELMVELFDFKALKLLKLKEILTYAFLPITPRERRDFQLTVGSKVFLEQHQPAPELLAQGFGLAQNFPNPCLTFHPYTTIQYRLAATVPVSLMVYDLMGRAVRQLAHVPAQAAGDYGIRWDGLNDQGAPLASGIYFYVLRAGTFQAVRKLIITH